MYSPYFGHVLGYWQSRYNPNILFVTYEELHQDPPKIIRKMAEFLGVSIIEIASYLYGNTFKFLKTAMSLINSPTAAKWAQFSYIT